MKINKPFDFKRENQKGETNLLLAFETVLKLIDSTHLQYNPIVIALFHSKDGKVKFCKEHEAKQLLKENVLRYNLVTLGYNKD